ncbi:site-specific integrase [Bordetella bronchiseptica]|uniref:site-specific integrase n=1 Tax=Bordetella bronchiseptica TaxID=518 RepID=UPI00067C74C8|nr:site-specific integrase [Bordetella bronchiseptica]
MATISEYRGKFRCQVRKKGHRPLSATFERRKDAEAWGREMEARLDRGDIPDQVPEQRTWAVSDLLDWYLKLPESKAKRSAKDDAYRAARLIQHIGSRDAFGVTSTTLAAYKRTRLSTPTVLPGRKSATLPAAQTVQHELSLLRRAYVLAGEELGWKLPEGIPKIRRPAIQNARNRRIRQPELLQLIAACHSPEAGIAFELAVETAMRRGEMLPGGDNPGLELERIDLQAHTVYLDRTKTDSPRTVPLSLRAEELIRQLMQLRGLKESGSGPLFSIKSGSALQALKRAAGRIGSTNLRFHDFRHEATSRLFEKGLSQIEVARITGHKTLSMLDRYTHLDVLHLVSRLRSAASPGA